MKSLCPLLATLLLYSGSCAPAPAAERPPNLVIVFADDMGYGDPQVYNDRSRIPTPHIDALAERGMRFTDAHTASSVCTPSRYGLLTGRYPWRSRLPVGIVDSWGGPVIDADRLTLGKMLQQKGYATACIGKWHLGWDWPLRGGGYLSDELEGVNVPAARQEATGLRIDFSRPIRSGPVTRGFDYYFGDDVPNFPPYAFLENDRVLTAPTDRMPAQKGQRVGPMTPNWDLFAVQPTIAARAIEWLEERAAEPEKPFFLYMPLLGPHTPIVPSYPYRGRSDAGQYGDWAHQMDAMLGRVVETLERTGQMENTIVVFSSDNGSPARSGLGTFGQTNTVTELYSHVPNAPWRGLKADAWEAGHRVPLVIRWDGRIRAGVANDVTVCLTDLFATVAELFGVELPDDAGEDSFSLAPLLLANRSERYARRQIVHHSHQGLFAIRKGDWKLILGSGSGGFSQPRGQIVEPGQEGPMQLYLLTEDPSERRNRIEEFPARKQELLDELGSLIRNGRSR
ncbi:MAG: sulfatase-like hydrolase/transferase [Acidobacteria bacterium]|nr:sulfatase-like hydrolase/transferase [Acidobacteriota bacterium]